MLFGIFSKKNKNRILHVSVSSKTSISAPSNKGYVRKAFLFSSQQGSLTLEASIVLPLYILFIAVFVYILDILNLQNTLSASMEEACRNTNKYSYVLNQASGVGWIDNIYLRNQFFTDGIKTLADKSYIKNGYKGIKALITYPTSDDDVIDFNLYYSISIPFFPDNMINLNLHQRCYFHTFTGVDITNLSGAYTQYVYITSSGTVYHTSVYCSYLSPYYSLYPSEFFENQLNNSSNYSPCSSCARNSSPDDLFFYCPGSQVYHYKVDCFYLAADVYKVTLDSVVDSKPLCSRCSKGVN